MSISEKISIRDIVIGIGLIVVFAIAMLFVLNIYKHEGEERSADISEAGEKDPNHIECYVKILSVDPVKGDVSARIEFTPHGNYAKEEGSTVLARNVKLYVNSANGKQETDFAKGKRMNPVEIVISLYDGLVTDYPFDHHSGFLEMYLTSPAEKPAEKPAETPKPAETSGEPAPAATPAASPAPEGGSTPGEPKKEEPKKDAAGAASDDEVSMGVDFYGSVPGMKIEAEKTKDSDDNYVGVDMKVSRSSTVVFFSLFVMVLMWGATIAVLLLVLSVVLRERKIEVGMFSFLAALIFALIAVRNAQPGVPPIGTYSDFISFFWAEVILVLCLLGIIFTWLLRPTAK